jgi:hypothetical protein
LWTAYRKPVGSTAAAAPEPSPQPTATAASSVSGPVARRALAALGPLVAALGTGAILYGVSLGNGRASSGLIWGHVGVSLLALLLVIYKVASVRRARIRRGLTLKRLTVLISVVLGSLFVPLLITGIQLLIAPSNASFAAYAHLVSSVWWSGLLLWHLRRYLGPAFRGAIGRSPGGAVPVAEASARLPAR